jgi:hypothetical protein
MKILFNCISLIIIFNLLAFSSLAQTELEDAKENLLQQQEEQTENNENDVEGVEDQFQYLANHPIEINKATIEDLQPLVDYGLLNEIQTHSIINYKENIGKLISIYELQAIPYLEINDINNILPFIKLNNQLSDYQVTNKYLLLKGDWMLLTRVQQVLQDQKGYTPIDTNSSSSSRYLGSQQLIYSRFRYNYGTRFSYGLTTQKDAGEEFFKGSQKNGFDFYSAHLFYRGNKFLKSIAIGDYQVKAGQSLILGTGLGGRKGPQVMLLKKGGNVLKPYTSVNEFLFFRGIAATLGYKKIQFTPFYSYKKIDANVTDTIIGTEDNQFQATSFGGDGLHRTVSEVADKNNISQTIYGGVLQYKQKNFSLGANLVHTDLGAIITRNQSPYNKFQFSSNNLTTSSLDYSWQLFNMLLFGEVAQCNNGGIGVIQGLQMSVAQQADIAFVFRNFQKNFQSLYSNAFAESATTDNEQGLYTAISLRLRPTLVFDGYIDWYKKPWIDFQIDAPSFGTEYFSRLTYKPNKKIEMYAQYRNETKQANSNFVYNLDNIISTNRQSTRLHFVFKVSPSFVLKSRAEFSRYDETEYKKPYKGFLAYQDIQYKQLGSPLTLTFRYSIFNVDDYDARIYVYENDVLYGYSIPAFQNKGTRYYIIARYTMNRHIDFWIRYAQTTFDNLSVIGSGLDEIASNKRSEIKIQARLKF